ncbi:MAG: AI-2E family transporter [Methanoregula sp.]|jgi:predicted PurR-regulated permease PerM
MTLPRIDKDLQVFLFVVALALIVLVAFWGVFDMVILGASLAVVLVPLYHRLTKRIPALLSAFLVTLGVLLVVVAVAYVTFLIMSDNSGVLTSLFSTIGTWLADPSTHPEAFGIPLAKETLSSWLATGESLFLNYGATVMRNLGLVVFKGFVFLFSLFIILVKGEELKNRVFRHLPGPVKRYCVQLESVTVDTLYVIYIVQIAIAVLTFFIAIPVFYFLGYGNVLFYSFLAAFCELIPILGSSVAFIVIGAYSLAIGDMKGVFILFVFGYLIVSAMPEVYIRPVLVGRRVKIHPVIMFVGLIGGLLTMGLAGFVLGPLLIVLLMRSYRIWTDERKTGREAGVPGR